MNSDSRRCFIPWPNRRCELGGTGGTRILCFYYQPPPSEDGEVQLLSVFFSPLPAKIREFYISRQLVDRNKGNDTGALFDKNGQIFPIVRELLLMTYLEGITNYENLLSQEEDLPVDSLLLDKQSLAYSSFAEDLKKGNFCQVAEQCGLLLSIGKSLLDMPDIQKKDAARRFVSTGSWNDTSDIQEQVDFLADLQNKCNSLAKIPQNKIKQLRLWACSNLDDSDYNDEIPIEVGCPDQATYKLALLPLKDSENPSNKERYQAEWHAIRCVLTELLYTHFQEMVAGTKRLTKKMFVELWLKRYPYARSNQSYSTPANEISHVRTIVEKHSAFWTLFPEKRSHKVRDLLHRWGLDWLKSDSKYSKKDKYSLRRDKRHKKKSSRKN